MSTFSFRLAAFFFFGVVAIGCASSESTTTASDTSTTASSTAALDSLYWQRQDEARTRYTQADVDFMTGMIGHHAQALVMSDFAPKNGASPQIQTLAARIINAQNDEIASMQTWLRDRDQPVPEVHIEGSTLMIHVDGGHGGHGGHADHTNMPGMLSQAQMDELENARGAEFDKLYLKYMIQHHSGAITMVNELFSHDGAGQDEASFKLASDINVDQETEIARMKLMLEALEKSSGK